MITTRIENSISAIVTWGLDNSLHSADAVNILKKQLVELYYVCLSLSFEPDEKVYPDYNSFDYNTVVENVKANFPEFGYYSMPLTIKPTDINQIVVEDAVDDLADIILDLLQIKWRFENTSSNDALWSLDFHFKNHFEKHLTGLLYYINNYED